MLLKQEASVSCVHQAHKAPEGCQGSKEEMVEEVLTALEVPEDILELTGTASVMTNISLSPTILNQHLDPNIRLKLEITELLSQ